MQDKVTIVLPTRARRDMVAKTIERITHRPLMLVVDKGRESEDLPANLDPTIDVVSCEPSGGPVKACEAGVMAAKTSHVLTLCDDLKFHGENGEWLDEACRVYRERFGDKEGVVALNDGNPNPDSHELILFPKAFFERHCRNMPYTRYFFDTDIWSKAKRLDCAAKAMKARLTHTVEGGRDFVTMKAEREVFNRRMADFVRANPNVTKKLFVALPVYWNVDPMFFQCVLRLIENQPCDMQIDMCVGDSAIGRARNLLTRRFLESDCTHLLFIDTDLIFSADHIAELMAVDEPVVGGFYPKKTQDGIHFVINALKGKHEPDERGLIEVMYMGTGFIRIARSVFEKMIEKFGDELVYTRDEDRVTEYDFWKMGTYQYPDGARRWLSEDWLFCQRWLDCGGKVYGHGRVLLKHSGNVIYPLKHQEEILFRNAPQPDAGAGSIPTAAPATAA